MRGILAVYSMKFKSLDLKTFLFYGFLDLFYIFAIEKCKILDGLCLQ